jgi:hypothetical protein
LNLNFGICGDRPANGRSYLQDSAFLTTVEEQTQLIAKADGLPKELKEKYDKKLAHIHKLISTCNEDEQGCHEPITCSLVESIGEIPIPGVQTFGNLIVIPNFGSVALGEIEVGERMYPNSSRPDPYFELTGIKMKLGCIGHGTVATATATANGHSHP